MIISSVVRVTIGTIRMASATLPANADAAKAKELIEKEGEWKNVNDELIAAGLANSWDGSGAKPV